MKATYQRLKKQREQGEISGFTLIELLIVIVVLGILAAVVIFALGGITGKSQLAACQADGATVSTAYSALRAQNPNVTFANLTQGDFYKTTAGHGVTGGPYIQSWPSATSYKYTIPAGVLTVQKRVNGTTVGTAIAYTGPSSCGKTGGIGLG